jgi:hypothetical protein
MQFPSNIPPNVGSYVSAGGFVYAANTVSRAWIKQGELALKNNQLRHEREKTLYQQNRQQVEDKRAIYRECNEGVYSESIQNDLLNQIQSIQPIYAQQTSNEGDTEVSPKTKSQETQTPSKYSSITLSTQQKNLKNKNYKSEISTSEFSYPYEFQEVSALPFSEVLRSLVLILIFGLVLGNGFNWIIRSVKKQIEVSKNRNRIK